jgi:antitoxin HigA-1
MITSGPPAIPPGKCLAEIRGELGMSQAEFARSFGGSPMRVLHILRGNRPVAAERALLFGPVFGQSPQYWLSPRSDYDLAIAEKAGRKRLKAVEWAVSPVADRCVGRSLQRKRASTIGE